MSQESKYLTGIVFDSGLLETFLSRLSKYLSDNKNCSVIPRYLKQLRETIFQDGRGVLIKGRILLTDKLYPPLHIQENKK